MSTGILQTGKKLAPLQLANGKQLPFDHPLVMGIVNITPDSFYDGGKYVNAENAIEQVNKLLTEGADIIDLGAASTRPGAELISCEDELKRILPVLDVIVTKHPNAIISIDTFRSEVAERCIEHGAAIINDISGGTLDEKMFDTVAKLNVPYIIMHVQGTPQNMQVEPTYNNVVTEVYDFLAGRVDAARTAGIKQIVVDPGFGFGKTIEHNYLLLRNLSKFKELGLPILTGVSRKSMINKVLKTKPENALTGTIALNTLAVLQGTNILRVHDVKEAKQVIKLVNQFLCPDTEI
jgi:dihydropteroate synthase